MASSLNSSDPATQAAINNFNFQSRDEVKKLKELEEARKAGLIPAEKDEEGNEINPHIPQYMIKAPWYLKANQTAPSLKHQRHHEEARLSINDWYTKWTSAERPTKFRKGACQNCGSMTHKLDECVERPRKKGAKWTNFDLKPDEYSEAPKEALSFDAKRDRWGGYDPDEFSEVVARHEEVEMERLRRKESERQKQMSKINKKRKKKERKRKAKIAKIEKANEGDKKVEADDGNDSRDSSDSDSDSDSGSDTESNDSDDGGGTKIRDFDEQNAPVGTKDDRTRTTTRNLRIREDTAKYLYNLDVNSAFYDPKTRSTRDNPMKNFNDSEQGVFQGDNALRNTGDAMKVPQMEAFAWDVYKHGTNVHFQAMPTQLEQMHKQHQKGKASLVDARKERLLNTYGGRENMEYDRELLLGQTEAYREFESDGTIKKGGPRMLVQSKYEEDVYLSNHTTVWGSWFDRVSSKWGFGCCHSTDKEDACQAATG